jgi:hypothetical protein
MVSWEKYRQTLLTTQNVDFQQCVAHHYNIAYSFVMFSVPQGWGTLSVQAAGAVQINPLQ